MTGRPIHLGSTCGVAPLPASAAGAQLARPPATHAPIDPVKSEWPVQVRRMAGQVTPQDPATLPRGPAPARRAPGLWIVAGWRPAKVPGARADGATGSRAGFDARSWSAATVPGTVTVTVLSTLVDRGVYPDPACGLDTMTIPERPGRQDGWYRTEIAVPAETVARPLELVSNGVSCAAEIRLNGQRLGTMKGAFVRRRFDLAGKLPPGRNAIAVKVPPPPHPGVAHAESLTAGVGENRGMQMLDGQTFVATERNHDRPGENRPRRRTCRQADRDGRGRHAGAAGERRHVELRYPVSAARRQTTVALRGWNVTPTTVKVR